MNLTPKITIWNPFFYIRKTLKFNAKFWQKLPLESLVMIFESLSLILLCWLAKKNYIMRHNIFNFWGEWNKYGLVWFRIPNPFDDWEREAYSAIPDLLLLDTILPEQLVEVDSNIDRTTFLCWILFTYIISSLLLVMI